MYEYYNAHPQGKHVNDCVKRAITIASGMSYEDVSRALNRYKKITGASVYNDRKNCDAYVEKVLLGKKMSFPAKAGHPRMNGARFCDIYPKGNYILNMAGHWSVCVDGVIKDSWNCSEKCVYSAWKVEPRTHWYTLVKSCANNGKYFLRVENPDMTYTTTDFTKAELKMYIACLDDLGYRERGK